MSGERPGAVLSWLTGPVVIPTRDEDVVDLDAVIAGVER